MTDTQNEEKKKDMKDVLAAADQFRCAVQRSMKFVEEFLSEPMCGRCFPCSLGSFEALMRLKRLSAGVGEQEDIDRIRRITAQMLIGSMCKKGKDTAQFLLDSLGTGVFEKHIASQCADNECLSIVTYKVIPEKCVLCGICKDVCKYNAITGEKKKTYLSGYLPFEIRQKRCVKCGDCLPACPYAAIEIVKITEKEGVGAGA